MTGFDKTGFPLLGLHLIVIKLLIEVAKKCVHFSPGLGKLMFIMDKLYVLHKVLKFPITVVVGCKYHRWSPK